MLARPARQAEAAEGKSSARVPSARRAGAQRGRKSKEWEVYSGTHRTPPGGPAGPLDLTFDHTYPRSSSGEGPRSLHGAVELQAACFYQG